MSIKNYPKGILVVIGGAEDKGGATTPTLAEKDKNYNRLEILKGIKKKDATVELIVIGSDLSSQSHKKYVLALKRVGYKQIKVMHIEDRGQTTDRKLIRRAKAADTIFFCGGDQFQVAAMLDGTELIKVIHDRYLHDKSFTVVGTSAGAMVMSVIMMGESSTDEALLRNDLTLSGGFGFLATCIIDTHFVSRGRFGRLAHAVISNPGKLGVGLGEDAALVIREGCMAECRGSGMVILIDASTLGQSNIGNAGDHCPVYAENLKVHVLTSGCTYQLNDRIFMAPTTDKY